MPHRFTRMISRNFSSLAFILAMLAMPVVANAEKQEIIVWGLESGVAGKGVEAVIREFEKRNPQYKVRALKIGAGEMDPQKLMTSIVGGVPPDVINQDRFTINDWASRGAFRSLNDLIERDRHSDPFCPTPEQYYPATWAEASYEGEVYGIPTSADDRILYYNKDLFRRRAAELRAAGLDPNRPPRTWSEILAYSKVLTEQNADGTLRVAGFLPNWGNSWLYLYAFQMNAQFMSPDGKTCTLYTPASEKALRFMKEGYDQFGGYKRAAAFQSGFQSGENDPFIVGKIAMKIDGDWIIKDLSKYGPKLDFGVAPAPVPDDRYYKRGDFANEKNRFVTWFGGFSLAIPKGARNIEGGWKFLKFMTSLEGRMIENKAMLDWEHVRGKVFVPRMSAHIEANERLASAPFRPADKRLADAYEMHKAMAEFGSFRPATPVGQLLWDRHVKATDDTLLGIDDAKSALISGQEVVQRELNVMSDMHKHPTIDMRLPAIASIGIALCLLVGAVIYYRNQKLGRLASHETKWALILISPWLIGFFIFTLGPMLASLFFSFTHYNVLSDARWAGVENYAALITTDRENILKSFGNVLYMGGVGVPLGIFTGLSVALILNTAVRGIRFYRTMFYIPAIVPLVASAVLWIWILSPDPNKGLINSAYQSTLGTWFGWEAPGWLTAPEWTKPGLIMMGVWGAGSGMLLWLAGLKGIPRQLYEAASIDGASHTKQLLSITLPQLSPLIFFNCVMGLIGAMQEFDRMYIMANKGGGPGDSLLTPVMHLFRNGFNYFKMGYASALAWVVFLIILGLTVAQLRLSKKWVRYEVEH